MPAQRPDQTAVASPPGRLRELALVFLRLGAVSFGGPAAHIALMEDELVGRRRWLSREEFLDRMGAANLIPGPNSTEVAIHIGHLRAGWQGLLVAGGAFILPAAVIVWAIASVYVRYGTLPQLQSILYGVKPVVIAVVLQALWTLGRTAVKTPLLGTLGAAAIAAAALSVHELIVLAVAAGVMGIATGVRRPPRPLHVLLFSCALTAGAAALARAAAEAASATPFSQTTLFLTFAKIGSLLFGSGYVLLAFVRADFVERLHWLTEAQLLDAIAVGQVTPGPLFTTATFVGRLLGGTSGAIIATAGIFLPAFLFVAISGPVVPRLRRSRAAGAVLDGINVASLALMVVVTWQLARAALVDLVTLSIAVAAAIALLWFRVNSAWLVLAGAVLGWVGGTR